MKTYDPFRWYWYVGSDRSRAFSSAIGSYVAASDATLVKWMDDGTPPTVIDTEASMIAVLREANVPPYHRIRKSAIIARLTDAQLAQAIASLTVRQQERWRAPDQPFVNADDAETIAVIKAVGAYPAIVLAPE